MKNHTEKVRILTETYHLDRVNLSNTFDVWINTVYRIMR